MLLGRQTLPTKRHQEAEAAHRKAQHGRDRCRPVVQRRDVQDGAVAAKRDDEVGQRAQQRAVSWWPEGETRDVGFVEQGKEVGPSRINTGLLRVDSRGSPSVSPQTKTSLCVTPPSSPARSSTAFRSMMKRRWSAAYLLRMCLCKRGEEGGAEWERNRAG